ncbi:hypothetical protein ACFLIN_05165 [Corynebacterium kutscheri]|uniref:hypothetical protein n=1 Tax=Corynebacterium kutscheri TaxID=35755 RepID=UPI0037C10A96
MISYRKFSKLIVSSTLGFIIACSTTFPASAQNYTESNTTQSSHDNALLGSDGLIRKTRKVEDADIQGRKLDLQPGDIVKISADGQQADIINSKGEVVGSFTSPGLYDHDGNKLDTRFVYDDEILSLIEDGALFVDACGKSTLGKWTYRVGAAGVCGAFGAGTSGLGGAACGLGFAALEDQINFDKVC